MKKKYLSLVVLSSLVLCIPSLSRAGKSVATLTAPKSTIDVEVIPVPHHSEYEDVENYQVDIKGWYCVGNNSPSEITRQVVTIFELASRNIKQGKDPLHWSSNDVISYCSNSKIRSLISGMVLNNCYSPDDLLKIARYMIKSPKDFDEKLSLYLDLKYSKEYAENPAKEVSVDSSYLLPGESTTRVVRNCYSREDLQKLIDLQREAARRFIKAMESIKAKAGQKARKGKQGR